MAQGHTLREIEQIPSVLNDSAGRQRAASLEVRKRFGTRMPPLVATFLRYAFEIRLGVPGASIAPSIASVYGRQLMLDDALCLVISQSGHSWPITESLLRTSRSPPALRPWPGNKRHCRKRPLS